MTSRTRSSPFSPSRARRAVAIAALFGAVGLAGAYATYAATSGGDVSGPSAETAIPVRVRQPAAAVRPSGIVVSGSAEASTAADVAFQVGGRVDRVLVEEGDYVRAGDVLGVLDAADYRLSLEQAALAAERARDEAERMRSLWEAGGLAPNDYEKARTAARVAEVQRQMAARRLADARLVAPFDGVVTHRRIEPGETAVPGAPVFGIAAVDPISIRVGIPEMSVHGIRTGSPASVLVPALGGLRLDGRVAVRGASADPTTRTYTVRIRVPNPGRAVLPGMIAEARIRGDTMIRVLTLPGEVIVRDAAGLTSVYVYSPAERRAHRRRVEIGAPLGQEVEIARGLTAGDQVIVAGQHRVRDGSLLQVQEQPR